ncbi:MAG: hypothetical protein HZB31_03170 [Nitrospirae bacterium]|nr:hypothetical protein [Nitrospirota bacterium]
MRPKNICGFAQVRKRRRTLQVLRPIAEDVQPAVLRRSEALRKNSGFSLLVLPALIEIDLSDNVADRLRSKVLIAFIIGE